MIGLVSQILLIYFCYEYFCIKNKKANDGVNIQTYRSSVDGIPQTSSNGKS